MSQINEGWASRTQEERDEMTKKEREQRILALSKKYGSKKVKQAQKEVDDGRPEVVIMDELAPNK